TSRRAWWAVDSRARPARCGLGSPERWCWRMTDIGRNCASKDCSLAILERWNGRSPDALALASASSSASGKLQILTPLDLALGPFGVEREMRAAAETTQGKG